MFHSQPGLLWIGEVVIAGPQENYVVPPLTESIQLSSSSGIVSEPNLLGKAIELLDEWQIPIARGSPCVVPSFDDMDSLSIKNSTLFL